MQKTSQNHPPKPNRQILTVFWIYLGPIMLLRAEVFFNQFVWSVRSFWVQKTYNLWQFFLTSHLGHGILKVQNAQEDDKKLIKFSKQTPLTILFYIGIHPPTNIYSDSQLFTVPWRTTLMCFHIQNFTSCCFKVFCCGGPYLGSCRSLVWQQKNKKNFPKFFALKISKD